MRTCWVFLAFNCPGVDLAIGQEPTNSPKWSHLMPAPVVVAPLDHHADPAVRQAGGWSSAPQLGPGEVLHAPYNPPMHQSFGASTPSHRVIQSPSTSQPRHKQNHHAFGYRLYPEGSHSSPESIHSNPESSYSSSHPALSHPSPVHAPTQAPHGSNLHGHHLGHSNGLPGMPGVSNDPGSHGPGRLGLGEHWIKDKPQSRSAIPGATVSPTWKTPYSYGYFGAKNKRHWSHQTGYRDRYLQWTLR